MKKNIKMILTTVITAIICISGTVYATTKYLASDVTYKNTTVENALNDLYFYKVNDNYSNKPYTQDGLTIYKDRVTILNGGYYTDKNKVTWVNITFKTKVELTGNAIWLLFTGLPKINNKFVVNDENREYAFYIGSSNSFDNAINFFSYNTVKEIIPIGKTITLKFKYN